VRANDAGSCFEEVHWLLELTFGRVRESAKLLVSWVSTKLLVGYAMLYLVEAASIASYPRERCFTPDRSIQVVTIRLRAQLLTERADDEHSIALAERLEKKAVSGPPKRTLKNVKDQCHRLP
jgi:hypothetical protein